MPVSGYFDTPFAIDGDLGTIPDPAQPGGTVSYNQGFPVGYSTPVSSGGFDVPRVSFNQIFNDITTAIQQLQQNGAPPFITSVMNGGSPFSYGAGAIVLLGGAVYISTTASNVTTPGTAGGATSWRKILTIATVGECYFQYTSPTVVTLIPSKGNQISFPNGAVGVLPNGGYASTNSSLYLNGTAAQALAASTLYYAYAWFNGSGNLVVDFSTTGTAVDANTGITIKSGDPTRVCVGLVYTTAGAAFSNTNSFRGVISYFNRKNIFVSSTTLLSGQTEVSTSPADILPSNNLTVLSWGDEASHIVANAIAASGTGGDSCDINIGIGNTTPVNICAGQMYSAVANQAASLSCFYDGILSLGQNIIKLLAAVNAGTGTYSAGGLSGFIRG